MPGWMPLTGLLWLPTSLGCSSELHQLLRHLPYTHLPLRSLKVLMSKTIWKRVGMLCLQNVCHMLRRKRRYNSLSENLINSRNDHARLKLLAIVDYRVPRKSIFRLMCTKMPQYHRVNLMIAQKIEMNEICKTTTVQSND